MKKEKICGRRLANSDSIGAYILLSFFAICCLVPLIVAFSVSVSEEKTIVTEGYCFLPETVTLDTYEFLLAGKGKMLLQAYGMSLVTVVCGTLYSMFIMTCYAYAISQKKKVFPYANALSFFAWFTTVFSGGVLPWFILCTRYYGLRNNIWALFLPYGMNVFNMFIIRNSFKALPEELMEAAKIDGASNFQVFTKISIPLAKSGLVTVTLFTVLQYWNDFALPLYLTTKSDYYTVQKLLYNMMSNITALLSGYANIADHVVVPSNTAQMAMCVLTILPIALVFPFAQKYFVKGITVGAVKG